MPYNKTKIEEIKSSIIEGLSLGKSLKSILDNDKELPSRPTVYNWLNKNHEDYDQTFFNNYVRAREESADLDAEKIEEIADRTLTGEYKPDAARVAIDALKWSAGKKKPKKYGDKLDLSIEERPLTSEERRARIAQLMSKMDADGQ